MLRVRQPVLISVIAALATLSGAANHSAVAQSSAPATLFTWRDGALAGGFAALTVAMFPLDKSFATRLQNPGNQTNQFLRAASRDVQYVADPGALVIGASLYTVGRVAGWRDVADLGLHGTEAVALSGTITAALKGLLGRARPYVSADTSPGDFAVGRGFAKGNGYESLPSGHTTVAFAAAAAITSESAHWRSHRQWIIGPLVYGGATLVGLSRMYNNAHWASDVALGAGIGTFSGLKVVRYSHHHPDNVIDRALLQLSVIPAGARRVVAGYDLRF